MVRLAETSLEVSKPSTSLSAVPVSRETPQPEASTAAEELEETEGTRVAVEVRVIFALVWNLQIALSWLAAEAAAGDIREPQEPQVVGF